MTINIRVHGKELAPGLTDGAYELPDGLTIDEAFAHLNAMAPEGERDSTSFLINRMPSFWNSVLKDGDELRIIRKVFGG